MTARQKRGINKEPAIVKFAIGLMAGTIWAFIAYWGIVITWAMQ